MRIPSKFWNYVNLLEMKLKKYISKNWKGEKQIEKGTFSPLEIGKFSLENFWLSSDDYSGKIREKI
jgi:hypothetical protein